MFVFVFAQLAPNVTYIFYFMSEESNVCIEFIHTCVVPFAISLVITDRFQTLKTFSSHSPMYQRGLGMLN
jgi:hypothetical protein